MHLKKCPDCGGAFEEGAIMDHTYGGVLTQRFARVVVPDEKNQWAFKVYEEPFCDSRKVINYRCTKCNRLFPYAQSVIQEEKIVGAAHGKRLAIMVIISFGVLTFIYYFFEVLISLQ